MKITVRFVVEQDFEVDVKDEKLGLGSPFAVGDAMVSGGYDVWDVTNQENIFENPVSEIRPLKDMHFYDCNMFSVNPAHTGPEPALSSWLFEGETDPDPYAEDEIEGEIVNA